MKKSLKVLFISTALISSFLAFEANSLVGAKVVTDPGSYTRFASQLESLNRLRAEAQRTYNEIKDMRSSMQGNYGKGAGLDSNIRKMRNDVVNQIPVLQSFVSGKEDYDISGYESINAELDNIYVPMSKAMSSESEPLRKEYQQKALKSSLINAERILNNADKRFGKAEKLARQIDSTSNIKEAQDLTNRLLMEITLILMEMSNTNAELARAEASSKYVGIEDGKSEVSKKSKGFIKSDQEYLENARRKASTPTKTIIKNCGHLEKQMGYCK
ncbi:MAG: hypothetical protein J0H68_09840 [Sphingobacteriia bacterium]|nr:hypothetical protein [Sphingobacteriia bacterium]